MDTPDDLTPPRPRSTFADDEYDLPPPNAPRKPKHKAPKAKPTQPEPSRIVVPVEPPIAAQPTQSEPSRVIAPVEPPAPASAQATLSTTAQPTGMPPVPAPARAIPSAAIQGANADEYDLPSDAAPRRQPPRTKPSAITPRATAAAARPRQPFSLRQTLVGLRARVTRWELGLALLSFGVYVLTRFWELVKFPIYFFCDEAIQANLAAMLVRNGMRDNNGWWFPPYFLNAEKWNLGWSVYVHVIPVALFGRSEVVTRGTTALVSLVGAVAIALMLRLIYRQRLWWLGVLVLGAMPAWFIHSRTAFETVMMVSFYACFMLCYLLYRYRDPRFLYGAVVFGAMTFYSYANGQGVMVASVALLLLSDVRYHLQQRWTVAAALVLGGFFLLPFLRFQAHLPTAFGDQFQALNSYWVQDRPLGEKLTIYAGNYLSGLSPWYWFVPNSVDLVRHRWGGMGNIWLPFLPLMVLGLIVALRRWREPAYRMLVIALLAVPFSAASVAVSITRVLSFVVPATILIVLALDLIGGWLSRWLRGRAYAAGITAALGVLNVAMLWMALVAGPTWFPDYTIGGMQYGAPQLFRLIPQMLDADPNTSVYLSSTWANNPNAFADFYLDDADMERFKFRTIDGWMLNKQPLDRSMVFVMTAEEYGLAQASDKFVMEPPEQVVRYPDGSPGFYFVRLSYQPNVDQLFETERLLRAQPVEGRVTVDGEEIEVRYSRIDAGSLPDLFDDNPLSLVRGLEANPFVLEFHFPTPRTISGVSVELGTMERFDVRVMATPADGSTPRNAMQPFENVESDPRIEIALPGGAQPMTKLRIEIQDYVQAEQTHIHVREVHFVP